MGRNRVKTRQKATEMNGKAGIRKRALMLREVGRAKNQSGEQKAATFRHSERQEGDGREQETGPSRPERDPKVVT